jgi:phage-related protein
MSKTSTKVILFFYNHQAIRNNNPKHLYDFLDFLVLLLFPDKETIIFVISFKRMIQKFDVQFLDEALEFLDNLEEKARYKVIYNIQKARITNDADLFRKLKGEIWEFRTLFNKMHYRLFAFWDRTGKTETLVISTHGLIKKTDKTPVNEIEKAERMRKKYFEQKSIKP